MESSWVKSEWRVYFPRIRPIVTGVGYESAQVRDRAPYDEPIKQFAETFRH